MKQPKVTVVTLVCVDRWKFLRHVVEAVMKDEHVTKLVIVDNASSTSQEMKEGVVSFGDRVEIIRHERNLGSAGGFHAGLKRARETDCDFVFILDDDSVPEEGTIAQFLEIRKLFDSPRVILSGNRPNLLENKEFFYQPVLRDVRARGTFFKIFSFKKVGYFFNLLIGKHHKSRTRGPFVPVIPTEAFVYGGAFIPVEAVREAPLPDANLFLYGDDVEYSWGLKKAGYDSYLCAKPLILDIDETFAGGSHLFGLFLPSTKPFKVYYIIRNRVRLSVRHSRQNRIILFLNISVWIFGLLILGFTRFGPTKNYFSRASLIVRATVDGYFPARNAPEVAALP